MTTPAKDNLVQIKVTLYDDAFYDLIRTLRSMSKNLRPFFKQAAKLFEENTLRSFRNQTNPVRGGSWHRLTLRTVRHKEMHGYPAPKKQLWGTSGRLYRAGHIGSPGNILKITAQTLTFGMSVLAKTKTGVIDLAQLHNFGFSGTRPAITMRGKRAMRLPRWKHYPEGYKKKVKAAHFVVPARPFIAFSGVLNTKLKRLAREYMESAVEQVAKRNKLSKGSKSGGGRRGNVRSTSNFGKSLKGGKGKYRPTGKFNK